jgi:hypothetical protein
METKQPTAFEKAAAERQGGYLLIEFWEFLRDNKRWWLVPLVILILLEAVLVLLASSGAAPFIYPLF